MAQSVGVIIPTTGAPQVRQCIESVLSQGFSDVRPFIIIDGPEFIDALKQATEGLDLSRCHICVLPANVGRNGFYGHRVYAAFSHLIDADYLCFLDQDNWFDPEHVAKLVECIDQRGLDWAFSLRKVTNAEGRFLIYDESQSVGPWGQTSLLKLVDTNCYCLRTAVAQRMASYWHGGWGQDRVFYTALAEAFPNFASTGCYTINYRTRDDMQDAVLNLLARENAAMHARHPDGLPWVGQATHASLLEMTA